MGAPLKGNAALTWQDPDTANNVTLRVLQLREPLRELKYGHTQQVYVGDSLDRSQRQTFTVGSGAYELTGRLRFQDNPQALIDLIKAGSALKTITYYPNLADPGVNYACYLIKPLTPTVLKQDPNTGTIFGDQDVEIVLRQTNQKPFAAAQQNALLFAFRAGDRLQEGTYSRVGTARYAANSSNGYGTLSTATANFARLHWMSTKSSQGPRNVPTLLLEAARTNLVLQSGNLKATTVWGGGVTVTSGQADPAGGLKAYKINATATGFSNLFQTLTATVSTRVCLSCFLAAGTGGKQSEIRLQTTAGVTKMRASVVWSSGVPTFAAVQGTLVGPAERWQNGFYRQALRTTGALTTGKYQLLFIPASSAAASKNNSIIAYGPQAED